MMPPAISIDLDDLWASLATHGDPAARAYPTFLDRVVPRALELFAARRIPATFFVVGRDAADPRHRSRLAEIAAAGHEIGNHSYDHEPWFHLYAPEVARRQIADAEEAIERATGRRPEGYRAPGFSLTRVALEELVRRGYRYDSSTCPNLLGPVVTAYYRSTTRTGGRDGRHLRRIGGRLSDAFRPAAPYRWETAGGPILEIPVTTFPGLRLPVHVSYLQCLPRRAALGYLRAAVTLWRRSARPPCFLLHSTDLLGREDTDALPFVPGMRRPAAAKLAFAHAVLDILETLGRPVTLGAYARAITGGGDSIVARPAAEPF